MNPTSPRPIPARRYDLDWLRIIAFGLLIFYHIGMFYVSWDWHVKSAYAGTGTEWAMQLVNPWRLALLFLISGVASRFLLDKLGAGAFSNVRAVRLLAPLIFDMLVIVAPQSYYQLLANGEIEPGFWSFCRFYVQPGTEHGITTPTWNHLWYVVYLLVYSLLLVPLAPVLRRIAEGSAGRFLIRLPVILRLLLLPVLPFLLYRFALNPYFPTSHDLINDWANHAHSFTIFVIGFWIAKSAGFWQGIAQVRRLAPGMAVGLGLLLSLAWANWDLLEPVFSQGLPARLC
jgi:hypothetical protein